MTKTVARYVGIDVSRARLDVAVWPGRATWHSANDLDGIWRAVARIGTVQPTIVVVEAKGGVELPSVGSLAEAGLPVAVVNPPLDS